MEKKEKKSLSLSISAGRAAGNDEEEVPADWIHVFD